MERQVLIQEIISREPFPGGTIHFGKISCRFDPQMRDRKTKSYAQVDIVKSNIDARGACLDLKFALVRMGAPRFVDAAPAALFNG